MKKNSNLTWGIILVVFGVYLILRNFGIISFGKLIGTFWPLIIIFISFMFHVGYFSNAPKNVGLLVPGGVLLTVGIVCQMSMLYNNWHVLWPGFVLAPAVGLFELYIFGKKTQGLLIPIAILSGLSAIFFFSFSFRYLNVIARYAFPALIILLGLSFIVRSIQVEEYNEKDNNVDDDLVVIDENEIE